MIQRKRAITSGADLLRMALARGPGGLSLSQTAAWATMLGLAEMSDPALIYRLDNAAAFLDALMAGQLAAKVPGAAVCWAGRTLTCADGSWFSSTRQQNGGLRLHAVYDLGACGFSQLELTDARGAESVERGAPVAGEIRIGDHNFGRAASLARFHAEW